MKFADIALPIPLRQTFTYAVPEGMSVQTGHWVAVPFQRRKVAGIVVRVHDEAPTEFAAKTIGGILVDEATIPEELLHFLLLAAQYYLHPIGEVLRAATPILPKEALTALKGSGFLGQGDSFGKKSLGEKRELFARANPEAQPVRLGKREEALWGEIVTRGEVSWTDLHAAQGGTKAIVRGLAEKGLVTLEERSVSTFFHGSVARDIPPELTEAQHFAAAKIAEAIESNVAQSFLLHGVTGSGKTEVYLRVIDAARAKGKGALVLVPEIALTPQLVDRFRARFGDEIAVLHSALTDRERADSWRGIRSGELRIVVGARSALFAPVSDLGVIIVDEEHDPSFKQEEGFRYHARDMALLRADRARAICVLGSATPSVESFVRAEEGKISLLTLPTRANRSAMPKVEVIDLRRQRSNPHLALGGDGKPLFLFSAPLIKAVQDTLIAKGQTILFLNRRGFAPSIRCTDCGAQVDCPACSVSLTEHRSPHELRCHYCDFSRSVPSACSVCGSKSLASVGLGTEQLEAAVQQRFPEARVARVDRDTASGKKIAGILERMRNREIDILVGTQMVTKGHDLPGVTLVGVILADQSLAFPDFRAGERTFQLLAQVAGRAGRGTEVGRVIFQSFEPDHFAIRAAAQHDFEQYFRAEIKQREELLYPPFSRLVACRVDAADDARAKALAARLASIARAHPAYQADELSVMGPTAAPVAKVRGRYRYRFFVRGPVAIVRQVAQKLVQVIDEGVGAARAHIDVDPVSML